MKARALTVPAVVIVGALLTIVATSCAFLRSHTREVEALAYSAASIGTTATIEQKPQLKPAFEAALAELKPLVASGQISGAQLRAIVQRLPVTELASPTARIITDNATMVFDLVTGEPLTAETAPVVLALARGISNGIDAGLKAFAR